MGWGNCGTDSKGRPIGYVFEATCDHPECDKKIDRGLAFACGGMHGEEACLSDAPVCEGYFCSDHLRIAYHFNGKGDQICVGCLEKIKANPEWREDEDGDFRSVTEGEE